MVWDPLVRLFHWSLVAGFSISYFAHGEWMAAHLWAGYIVLTWVIVLLIIMVLTTTVSGVMLYGADAWLGPLTWLMKNVDDSTISTLRRIHEYSADGTLLLVLVHVAGVLWESVVHRENLVLSMITGRKREINNE